MSAADGFKAICFAARAIPGQMGLRPYQAWIVIGTWNGDNTGRGARAQDLIPILEANGQSPKIRVMNTEELALSGLGKGSMKIGPITAPFAGGGNPWAAAKAEVSTGQTLHIKIIGPDLPDPGALFLVKSWNADHALHETLVISPVAEAT
jgi:hypothetical protein